MSYEGIKTSLENGILTVTINRPEVKNAISPEMMVDITRILKDAAEDEQILFVVLTGEGDFYCSGFDIKSGNKQNFDFHELVQYRLNAGRNFVAAFIDFPKLLIAIVNGPAVGIGTTTLGLCDLVFCSTTATFTTPFTSAGLCAEGCSSYLFPRMMGNAMASKMLQFGQKIDANEAKSCGLVADIYELDEIKTALWPKIISMKENLSNESILTNKKLMRQWDLKTLHEVNNAEWVELENRFKSEDFIRFVTKFMSKGKKENKL